MARIVFMGTPDFAVPSLRALLPAHDIVAVVTQPDRPAGRKKQLRQSPVKQLALQAGIPILQPRRLRRDEATIAALRACDADVFVVAAYGQILPQTLLAIPRHGTVNVHASLLPRWRGAAPIQAAIRAGDTESGITIMLLDAGLDTGPLLAKRAIPLAADETGGSLHDKLALLGAELLAETLPRWLAGDIEAQAQNSDLATYAPRIKKTDGEIDWTQPALDIERLVRAMRPWPRAWTRWHDAQLTIHSGVAIAGQAQPGQAQRHGEGVAIGTGESLYCPTVLQLAGKQSLSISDFLNGYATFASAQLG